MRRQLSLFALALLIPILAFIGFLLFQYSVSERAHLEGEAIGSAQRISVAVDRELANLVAALDVLSLSAAVDEEDWEAFHAQVKRMRDAQGMTAVLRDMTGQQIVNARLPYGAPLPTIRLDGEELAWKDGRFFVSNLYTGPVSHQPVFSVTVPVMKNGERRYLLSLSLPAERIRDLILKEQPSADWTIAVVDRNGVILARNNRHEDFVGKSATADLLANTRGTEGTWNGTTVDGKPVFGAYARTSFSKWRTAVGIRDEVLEAPLRRSLILFGCVGVALAGLSLMIASFYARRIVIPMTHLARRAEALGRGEATEPVASYIREITLVSNALSDASTTLRERERLLRDFNGALEHEVSSRTGELVEANARLVAEAEQRERVEQQLRQAQKMEAVGQLTGGIAHDFNNLLAVITGNLDLLVRRVQMGRPNIERFAENALEAASRAAALTHRLLAFSRQQPLTPEPVDANKLVAGMSELLLRALGEGVEIETVLAGGLWRTHADPNQLENAVLNLAVNARDAMPNGGKLTIETCNSHIDELYSVEHGIPAGQYVLLAVTDTGEGMTPGTIARAFEPFFTTKGPSQGTGLGLSQVYGFVRQSGGHVKIYSEPHQGTTLKIYLPRFFGVMNDIDRPQPGADLPTGTETILLVEDEDNVRRINTETLRDLGYRVLEAEHATPALDLLDANPDVSLLFTDIMMPDINGRKLADEACRRRPDLRVLFTTGYTRNAVVHNGVVDPGVQLIAKPFTMQQLALKVREILDADHVPHIPA
jgi:signal transduction histidine kinase/ActR/RegA family two-component response regulator